MKSNKYENGVPWYTTGTAHIRVHFPCDDVKCGLCQLFRKQDTGKRIIRVFTGGVT